MDVKRIWLGSLLIFLMSSIHQEAASMTDLKLLRGFQAPTAITFDNKENMYVANWSNGTVEKIDVYGERSVFVSIPGSPAGLACDKDGFIYVSDYRDSIYKVSPNGKASRYIKGLQTPTGIFLNKQGELLIANRSSDEIVKALSDATVQSVVKNLQTPVGVVEDQDGTIYVTNYGGGIRIISPNQKIRTISDFQQPGCGIVIAKGEVLAVDNGAGMVRRIDINTLTSTPVAQGLKSPVALGAKPDGTIFVGTWGDGVVQQL